MEELQKSVDTSFQVDDTRLKRLREVLNALLLELDNPTVDKMNPVLAVFRDTEQALALSEKYPELSLHCDSIEGHDEFSLTVFSLCATITDILTGKRLAWNVDTGAGNDRRKAVVTSVQLFNPPSTIPTVPVADDPVATIIRNNGFEIKEFGVYKHATAVAAYVIYQDKHVEFVEKLASLLNTEIKPCPCVTPSCIMGYTFTFAGAKYKLNLPVDASKHHACLAKYKLNDNS